MRLTKIGVYENPGTDSAQCDSRKDEKDAHGDSREGERQETKTVVRIVLEGNLQ